MWVALGMLWLLALGGPHQAWSFCPSQCSCSLHILSDGSKARYDTNRCGGVGHQAFLGTSARQCWEWSDVQQLSTSTSRAPT